VAQNAGIPIIRALSFSAEPLHTPVLEGGDECAFLIGGQQIVAMTADAKQLLSHPEPFRVQDRRFFLGDERADDWLNESVSALSAADRREAAKKVPRQLMLSAQPNDYILTLIRVNLKLNAGVRVDSMLFVHNHNKANGGLPKLVLQKYGAPDAWAKLGFTLAETVIAKLLLEGMSVSEIAKAQSISREGVRFHVKGLLGKARCNRQSQLVAMLAKSLWNPGV